MTGALLSIAFALSTEAAGALALSRARQGRGSRLSASLLAGLGCQMAAAALLLALPASPGARSAVFWTIAGAAVLLRWIRFFPRPRALLLRARWVAPAAVLAVGGLAQWRRLYAWPLDTVDFRTIYGLRARQLFLSAGGLSDLFDRYRTPWHGFYPPGLALLYDAAAIAFGRFDERLLAIVPALAAAIVLAGVFELFVALDVPALPAALWAAVAAISPGLWASTEAGHAEVPLAAALVVAVSALLRGDGPEARAELRVAAALAGLFKNEGLILAFLLLGADLFLHRRDFRSRLRGHLAALAPGTAWMAAAALAGFPRDTGPLLLPLASWGPALTRIPGMLEVFGSVALRSVSGPFLLCLPLALGLAALRRTDALLGRAAAVSAVLLLQIVAVLYVYLVTPYHVIWLMWVSIERILAPLAVAEILVLASIAGRDPQTPTSFEEPSAA
ncbi:MAG: hypothetical protein M3S32_06830 [Acidobacteriota bacterium]|nr:hypothetical protein [Acidobacteriota bacterium]